MTRSYLDLTSPVMPLGAQKPRMHTDTFMSCLRRFENDMNQWSMHILCRIGHQGMQVLKMLEYGVYRNPGEGMDKRERGGET